jgi:hypothetical protein
LTEYRITIEVDNTVVEQQSSIVKIYGTAQVESATATQMLTFGIPVQAFEDLSECQPVTSPKCQSAEYLPFGVTQGRQPFWIVQPAFARLVPFFLSNPIGKLDMTVQLVVQVNVDLIPGSYIAFRRFLPSVKGI